MSDLTPSSGGAAPTPATEAAPSAPASAPSAASTLFPEAPTAEIISAPAALAIDPPPEAAVEPASAAPAEPPQPETAPPSAEAPIVYDFKLPDGFTKDEALLTDFSKLAAEAKLDPAVAQKVVDLQVKTQQAAIESVNTMVNGWVTELNADPAFATPQAKEASLRAIASAIDEFGGGNAAAIRQAFDTTLAGSNPAIVKFILAMSKALGEGKPTLPGAPVGKKNLTPAQRLFPNSN